MFIENTDTDIDEIPFPMILICPLNQMRKQHLGSETNSSYL